MKIVLAILLTRVTSLSIMLERAPGALKHKSAYYGSLTVGNPPQAFRVVYDTGSGNLMVPGRQCGSRACAIHNRYDAQASNTSSEINLDESIVPLGGDRDEVTVIFGTGSITGDFVKDDVCIGSLCSEQFHFVAASSESDMPFSDFGFDGVLGLALPEMSQNSRFSLLDELRRARALKRNLFTVFLSDIDGKSVISFGEIPSHLSTREPFFVNVSRPTGYWQVEISDITIDNVPQGICAGCQVAVDTGTSQLAGPSDLVRKLTDLLSVDRSCKDIEKLPKLGFVVDGNVLNLDPEDYIDQYMSTCELALMPLDVPPPNGPLLVLGDPFLRRFLTVYSYEDPATPRVGFAPANHGRGEEDSRLVVLSKAKKSSFLQRMDYGP